MISQERLKNLLDYNSLTGEWLWLQSAGTRKAGSVAGTLTHYGYREIKIDRRLYRSARLAVLYMTGAWPIDQVDHRNGVRHDDRWVNLRCATLAENLRNRATHRNNKAGLKGVYWCSQSERWKAAIQVDGRRKHIGSFKDKVAAGIAYQAASIELHGEFAEIVRFQGG